MQQRQSRPRLIQAMLDAFSLPDLRRRILFTIGILVAFRFIAHIPMPGVDIAALGNLFEKNALLGMLDLFSGGAMRTFSVAAMGVYPYITSSIIVQLMVPVIPQLMALTKEGEAGRNKMNQITHWLTVPLAMLQGYGQMVILQNEGVITGVGLSGPNLLPTVSKILTVTAGTMFLVWLGERIDERGIGNGISIIIFGGILTGLPGDIGRSYIMGGIGGLIALLLFTLAIVVLIILFTEGHRRIPVQYSRSLYRGGRMYRQAGSTHIPLRVNMAGMIPLIFAMAIMIFPGTVASYFNRSSGFVGSAANFISGLFAATSWFYWVAYLVLVVGFSFFYTTVIFQQQDLAGTLQKQGGFVPGIRPGRPTAYYLNQVVNHITWGGALFLGIVAITPFFSQWIANVPPGFMIIGSAGLLIVVGVLLDTMKQLQAQLLMRHYEGFIK